MSTEAQDVSTGIPAFDKVLGGLIAGDNVVWEVESIDHYAEFVRPYVATALKQGRKLMYFRFARHAPLIDPAMGVETIKLDPQVGFETFLDGIHRAVERAGEGAYHLFDSLSDLTADWYCDQMVGNFFQLTCPYLYRLDTIAYFALLRNFHSSFAMVPISETTQILLEVYRYKGKYYVQPLKVQDRTSPQMYNLHVLENNSARPVTESSIVSEILTASPRSALGLSQYHLGVWTRTFVQADTLLEQSQRGEAPAEAVESMFHRLLRMAMSRDERVLKLARRYFDLSDMVGIGKRLLGTGLIGGKSVGMLLARAILKKSNPRWNTLLEAHDSFYIPSDVFYTFLVRNGCWELRKRQLQSEDFIDGADEARQRILMGTFPPHIEKRFTDMLDYFGQSPIIVRSSSLLEDNFGNSFAGKYDSVFCANQGSRQERLANFTAAVKTVYASTMSEEALSYRSRHGILDRDEQMALLVQRVSGSLHGHLFFPQIAGVGFSFNPYAWSEYIDPEAGILRLVLGLGTRAVDRSDDDYTRIVALNAPNRRPETTGNGARKYTQHKVDVLDLESNRLTTTDFKHILEHCHEFPIRQFTSTDPDLARFAREHGQPRETARVLTFDWLISRTNFIQDVREMLKTLQDAYEYPVDVEFTANFVDQSTYKINIVQCRPLQVKGGGVATDKPADLAPDKVILESKGPVIGHGRIDEMQRFIYVVPSVYGQLPIRERYAIARLIGRLNRIDDREYTPPTMLLGPGRWGTMSPELGVPVSFAEISNVSVLCEIVAMREDLVPDVSLGTHFLSELIEMDILYVALFPNQEGSVLNRVFFEDSPNRLAELLPEAKSFEHIVRVIDVRRRRKDPRALLYANTLKQQVVCYMEGGD